jgi:hypothetical protein
MVFSGIRASPPRAVEARSGHPAKGREKWGSQVPPADGSALPAAYGVTVTFTEFEVSVVLPLR